MTTFQVRLEVFEGPMDLLLTLVRRESLDIGSLALAKVTNQYLDYLKRLEEIDVGSLAAFCEMASTLIVIKSRGLLPRRRDVEEDDESPDELAARLRAYQRYRQVADQLGHRERSGMRAFARVAAAPPDLPPRLDPGDARAEDLAEAFRRALRAIPREEEKEVLGVKPHAVRLSDRLGAIRNALRARGRLTFFEVLTDGPRTREFVIVSFLAVLELLRRRAVRVVQTGIFDEIMIEVRSTEALDASEQISSFFDEDPAHEIH